MSSVRVTNGTGKQKKDEVPYKQITQLPDNVKNNLPQHAREIYQGASLLAEDAARELARILDVLRWLRSTWV